jgi:hypothetical protein
MPSHFPATVLKLKTGMGFHDCSSLRDMPPQLAIMQSAAAKMHGNDIAVGRIIRDADLSDGYHARFAIHS